MMTILELFYEMDLDADGAISRDDLHNSALRLGWQWQEASLYAVLDLLTLGGPLSEERFVSLMEQILRDPQGPYGEALAEASYLTAHPTGYPPGKTDYGPGINNRNFGPGDTLVSHLEEVAGPEAGKGYRTLLESLCSGPSVIPAAESALLLIDLQRSFTRGAWAQSLGADSRIESAPIRIAFDNCARFLKGHARPAERMFTRCPFPPDSYGWDEGVAHVLESGQRYFIKPGNSVFWPPVNGFAQWVEGLLERGKNTLVMGGCTLTSCVRVSAVDTQMRFADRGLRVAVVLSLSGARTVNYLPSPRFGGLSPVECAVREMTEAGVVVLPDAALE